jgi:hypothetical protein
LTFLLQIKFSASSQREPNTFTRFFLHVFGFIISTVNFEPSDQSLNYNYCNSLITASRISFERVVTVSNTDSTLLIKFLKKKNFDRYFTGLQPRLMSVFAFWVLKRIFLIFVLRFLVLRKYSVFFFTLYETYAICVCFYLELKRKFW